MKIKCGGAYLGQFKMEGMSNETHRNLA